MAELLFKDPKEYILLEYQLRKNRRPAYSMRAFARDLQFSASSLNDFLKGRVGMSETRIVKLAGFLNWSESRTLHFKELVLAEFDKDPAMRQTCKMKIKLRLKEKMAYFNLDDFQVISDWYHLVIVELCQLKDHLTAAEITKLIPVTLSQAKNAFKNLLRVGLLVETKNGLKPSEETSQFGDDAPSDAIKNFHSQVIGLAQKMLFEKHGPLRMNHSLVFSLNSADREKMNLEIRKSLYQIVNKYAVRPHLDAVQIVSLHSFEIANATEEHKVI